MKKLIGFTLILTIFFSCSKNDELSNDEFIIYQRENITISLIEINDSRCPINVNCVWQGNAEVVMRITNNDEAENFTLNTAGYINDDLDFPTNTSIFDLNIELIDLHPLPEDGIVYALEDYTVNINVN